MKKQLAISIAGILALSRWSEKKSRGCGAVVKEIETMKLKTKGHE